MSQLEVVSEKIDGVTYTIHMLPPRQSMQLLTKVFKMVLPAIGPIIDAYQGKGSTADLLDQELDSDFFTKSATALADRLDGPLLDELCDAMAQVTEADGVPLGKTFDHHFAGGKLHTMVKWLGWSMKVQWGPTLSGLMNMAGSQAANVVAMGSRSQNTSTG